MADKELRDYLLSLQGVAENFHQAGQAMQESRQKDIRAQYLKNLPSQLRQAGAPENSIPYLVQSEQANPGAVDKALFEHVAKRALPDPKTNPLTADQLRTLNPDITFKPGQAEALSKVTRDEQDKNIGHLYTFAGLQAKGENADKSLTQRQLAPWTKSAEGLDKKLSAYRTEEEGAQNALSAMEANKLPSDAAAVNFYMRSVGKEKGRIPVQERVNFLSHTLNMDLTKASNFVESGDTSLLTEDQRQTFKSLIGKALKDTEGHKQTMVGQHLADFEAAHSGLSATNDEVNKGLTNLAKRYGLKREGGRYAAEPQTEDLTGVYAQAAVGANKIQDPTKKSQTLNLIRQYAKSGQEIPPERLKQLGVTPGAQ